MKQPADVGNGFRAVHKLLKTDEFSSVFAFWRSVRCGPFQLLYCANGRDTARLGVVVGKKFAPLAVVRNRVKRSVREYFRVARPNLPNYDLVVRLASRLEDGKNQDFRSDLSRLFGKLKP